MRKKRILIIVVCLFLVLTAWLIRDNTRVVCTEITVRDARIPDGFSGYRIAQVSDLHDARFGKNNARLLDVLRKAEPDIIVLTGDMLNSDRIDLSNTLSFARGAVQIAPTYFVSGNHEPESGVYDELCKALENTGVTVLEDRSVKLHRNGDTIQLIGLKDFSCYVKKWGLEKKTKTMAQKLEELMCEDCCIVLSHRPELIDYQDLNAYEGATLVLTGHAHGGQFRLPYLGGLYAPGQGLFPKYDAGLYRYGDTNMIVSRGLGNSTIQLRVNNPPEVVLAILEKD